MWEVNDRVYCMQTGKVGVVVGTFGRKFAWVKWDANGRTILAHYADLMKE